MIWLAAQIWIFLVVAFALGAGFGWAVGARRRPAPVQAPAPARADLDDDAPMSEPPLHVSTPTNEIDDLTQIIGLDAETAQRLNALGVYYLAQIAEWDSANVRWVEYRLDDPGRVTRERWPEQAASL